MGDQMPSHAHVASQRSSAPPVYQSCHDNVVLLRAELKIITDERDILRQEIERLQSRVESAHSNEEQRIQLSSVYKELESLQCKHADLLQSYDKEKDSCKQISLELAELITSEEELRMENAHLRQQLKSGDEGTASCFADMSTLKTDFNVRHQLEAVSIDKSGSSAEPQFSGLVGMLTEDNKQLKDEVLIQRKQITSLQQRLADVTQKANYDRTMLHDKLGGASVEKSRLELQLAMATAARSKDARDLARIRSERDAAVSEYQLVMSERDSVLRETEQLRASVVELESKVKKVEKDWRAATEDAQLAKSEAELTRKEAEAAAMSSSALIDTAYSKEIEKLRKDLDKIQAELMDALQELESSKQRCDWAFSERDKIVRECESIRSLCDQLRRERDSAVSELISALRDSDDMRRQKNDASRELKELRDRYDILLEKDMGSGPDLNMDNVYLHHSRDSAIDTDLHDLEAETLQVDLDNNLSADLGFSLATGSRDLNSSNGTSVYVRAVQPSSCAYGKLRPNDQLLRINGMDVSGSDVSSIFHMLHKSSGLLQLTLRRKRLAACRLPAPVHVSLLKDHLDLGVVLEQGQFISDISPGSTAAQTGCLAVGDRLLSVNGMSIAGKSLAEVNRMLDTCGDHIMLDVLRYQTTMTPASSITGSTMAFRSPSSPVFHGGVTKLQSSLAMGKSGRFSQSTNIGNLSQDIGSLELVKSSSSQPEDLDDAHRSGITADSGANRRTFFDRAVNVIKRPFQRSRINRGVRDARSKSAISAMPMDGVGSSEKIMDSLSAAVEARASHLGCERVGLSKEVVQDAVNHGTWPKYRTRATTRPTILPFDKVHRMPTSDDQSPLIPKPWNRDAEVRRSESARHHRPQASDSIVDYVNIASLRTLRTERLDADVHKQSDFARLYSSNADESVIPVSKHQLPTSSAARSISPENHLTVISHFPVNHPLSSQGSYSAYSPCPISRDSVPRDSVNNRSLTDYDLGAMHSVTRESAPYYEPTTTLAKTQGEISADGRSLAVTSRTKMSNSPRPVSFFPKSGESAIDASGGTSSVDLPSAISSIYPFGHGTDSMSSNGNGTASSITTSSCPPVVAYSDQSSVSYQRKNNCSGLEPDYHSFMGSKLVPSPIPPLSLMPIVDTPASSSLTSNGGFGPTMIPQMTTDRQGRIRIPSSRGQSPISPLFSPTHGSTLLLSSSTCHTLPHQHTRQHKDSLCVDRPHNGETRTVSIQLNNGRLGIDIDTSPASGGIFVSWVDPLSVAASCGIMVGDQLLEVCGINMRNATKQHAASVLRQLAGSVSILLQYNPQKYYDGMTSSTAAKSSYPKSDFLLSGALWDSQPSKRLGAGTEQSFQTNSLVCAESENYNLNSRRGISGEHSQPIHFLGASSEQYQPSSSLGASNDYYPPNTRLGASSEHDHPSTRPGSSHEKNQPSARLGSSGEHNLLHARSGTSSENYQPIFRFGASTEHYQPSGRPGALSDHYQPGSRHGATNEQTQFRNTWLGAPTELSYQTNSRLGAVIEQSMNQFRSRVNTLSSIDLSPQPEPRLVECCKVHPNDPIGLDLVGGNMSGIFVRQIMSNSPLGGRLGLRIGDQILQFNGVDFHNLTLEHAIVEIRKSCNEIRCWAKFNILKYNKTLVSLCGGDLVYLRAVRDHIPEPGVESIPGELTFKTGNILYVDNTAHAGRVGVWHAWLLDAYGNPTSTHGILPFKTRCCADDEATRRRSVCDVLDVSSGSISSNFNKMAAGLRSSGSFRRSLFRRRRHRRSDSRDDNSLGNHLQASHSDASLSSGCSNHTADDGLLINLERVEKLDCAKLRPVLMIGPFADQLCIKLTQESPDRYFHYNPAQALFTSDEITSKHRLPTTLHEDINIDYIKSIIGGNRHCLISAVPEVVEYLMSVHIFPIVLFIKHKSPKQIKEVKDVHLLPEKISSKSAKDMFERYQEYENVYQNIFSDVIPGGNLAFMCCKIKLAIDREQKKVVWVPALRSSS